MIQPIISILLSEEPTLAYIIRQSKVIYDNKGEMVNTAAVTMDESGQLIFIINPEYFLNLSFNKRVGLIYHECLHIVFNHLYYYKKLNPKVANIAMDVENDQKIPLRFLFDKPLLPSTVDILNNMPNNLTFMDYYEELMKHQEKLDKYQNPFAKNADSSYKVEGNAQGKDEHLWDDIMLSPETIKAFTKNIVKIAYQQVKASSGKINEEIELSIKNLLKPSKIPWDRHLENLIGSVISNNRQLTRTRPNKKTGYISPGEKDGNSPNVVFFVDISGSHVDEKYIKSFNQIKTILDDYNDDLKVFFFSDGVFDEHILVNSQLTKAPKKPGSGGTSFDPIFQKANDFDDIEAIIILTDGDASPPKIKPLKYRVIWGLTDGDRSYLNFGDKVLIGDDND